VTTSSITIDRDWFEGSQFIVLVDGRQVVNQYFPTAAAAEAYAATLQRAPFVATITPAPDGFDTALNGDYVGTFPQEAQAWTEAKAVATVEAQTITVDTVSPLVPFGIDAGPTPDRMTTLTPTDLARATEQLIDFYEDKAAIVSRAMNAYDLALNGLTDQYRPAEQRTVWVRENGDVTIKGSKTYWISEHGCTCPDYRHLVYGQKYVGSGAESGMCKHTLCREILRLAQVRQGVFDAESGNKTAFTSISAAQLVRALKALLKTQPQTLTLELTFTRARIHAGTVTKELTSTDHQGWGIRSLALNAADAERLISELAPIAKANERITLMLDTSEREVSIFGGHFGFSADALPS